MSTTGNQALGGTPASAAITGSSHRTRLRRLAKVVIISLLAIAVAVGAFLSVVAVQRLKPVELPRPTGTFPVGRLTYEWVDTSRSDTLSTVPSSSRALSVWVWYPASQPPRSAAAYAPGAWSSLQIDGPAGWFEGPLRNVRTHAGEAAPAALGRFTVVVLEPGMGLAAPEFTTLAEGLASHGYVVAGVTPTHSANVTVLGGRLIGANAQGNPPDLGVHHGDAQRQADRLLATWVDDALFARTKVQQLGVDPGVLTGHVDSSRTTYVGHSFGGAAALQACHDDKACVGAVDLDGTQFGSVVRTGLRAPMLLLGSENSCVTGTCTTTTNDDAEALSVARALSAASTGAKYCFDIVGTEHFDFTDLAVWYIAQPLRSLFPLGRMDGNRALTIETTYVSAFLANTVHGTTEPLLTATASQYPEVRKLSCGT